MYEPIGTLKITVWIRTASEAEDGKYDARRVTLFRAYCRRDEVEEKIRAFRDLNQTFDGLEAVWQAEPERTKLD